MRKSARKRSRPSLLPRQKRERRRTEYLGLVGIICFATVISGAFFVSDAAKYALRNKNVAAVVSAVLIDLANQDRAQNALPSLALNPTLTAAAQAKANDMAEKGYFAHVSPDGTDPWHWFAEAGYQFDYAGENLAVNFSDSDDVNNAWMNSPTHRENILNPHYTEIGIATAEGMYQGKRVIFVVQEFGSPSHKSAPAAVAQQSVPQNPQTIATAQTAPVKKATAPASHASPAPKHTAANVAGESTSSTARVTTPSTVMAVESKQPAARPAVAPAWAFLIAYPRTLLHDIYYALAFLIIIALAYVTRFEMRTHHLRHVGVASGLVVLIGFFLIVADFIVFTPPVLAAVAASL